MGVWTTLVLCAGAIVAGCLYAAYEEWLNDGYVAYRRSAVDLPPRRRVDAPFDLDGAA